MEVNFTGRTKYLLEKHIEAQSQFRSSYYVFFGSCWQETEKFRVNIYFETSEHSVPTADDNSKSIYFKSILNNFRIIQLQICIIS